MAANPKHEAHPHPTRLSDFILGAQDGLANILGILLGLSAATSDRRLILVAALAALGAESISMGAVAYTSTLSRRRLYLSERAREERELQEVPETEREEVRAVLEGWGYQGSALSDLLDRICANPKAMVEFMMAFELNLSPVESTAAGASAVVVGLSTVVGHLIPLAPFLVPGIGIPVAVAISLGLTAVALFGIGVYESRITAGSFWKNGVQMLVIGMTAGLAGFLIGHFLGAA